MPDVAAEAARRRTFAIISHPDAGKTTLTEKLLLFGGAIQMAGSVKSRKTSRHATSDWMALEQERGISVTSSVMQFPYEGRIVRSEEHTSELQSLMRSSYAVFCLKKKHNITRTK